MVKVCAAVVAVGVACYAVPNPGQCVWVEVPVKRGCKREVTCGVESYGFRCFCPGPPDPCICGVEKALKTDELFERARLWRVVEAADRPCKDPELVSDLVGDLEDALDLILGRTRGSDLRGLP